MEDGTMSVSMNRDNRKDSIELRRFKVQELLVKGYNHYEIADTLQIPGSTISGDIQYIRQQAQENLHEHIQERLPEEYQSCLTGINRILRLTLDIAEKPTTTDDKTKLQALALANECYKAKLDLTTNSVVVTDTISMLKNKLDHLNTNERELTQDIQENKLKKDCEESQQQQQTPSGIF
jgi:Cu/Ag efflux pump CusA